MPDDSTIPWRSLENGRSTAFLVGGALFIIAGILVVVRIGTGVESLSQLLGQAFIGAGWTAGFVGLLGLYPGLVDRSRWLASGGAIFAAIGAVTFAVMAVVALAFYAGIPDGTFGDVFPAFIPSGTIGAILGFVLFGGAVLRTGANSRAVGLLLLAQPVLLVVNALTPTPPTVVLVIVSGLAVVNLAVGFRLSRERDLTGRRAVERSSDPSAGP